MNHAPSRRGGLATALFEVSSQLTSRRPQS